MRAGKPAVWKSNIGDGSWFWTSSRGFHRSDERAAGGWEPTWIDAVRALEKELTARRHVASMVASTEREKEN